MKGFVALGAAIASELFGSSMLKLSDGFSSLFPSIGVLLGFGSAFYMLSISLRTVPLSLAYAIWSGIGTALTAVIGLVIWGEPLSLLSILGIVVIIGGVVLLNAPAPASVPGKDKQL